MTISNSVMIGVMEAESVVKKCAEDTPLEDRLRVAMKAMRSHWLLTSEDEQLLAAVGGVMLQATDEEKERLTFSMQQLHALNALLSGVPDDMEAIAERSTSGPEPVHLMSLWRGATDVEA